MAQTIEFKDELNIPASTVMEGMLNEKLVEEWTVVQKGISPKATLAEKSDSKAVMKVDLDEPIPGIGTIKAHMTFNWDLDRRLCTWTRDADGMAAKSKVSGTTEIVSTGDATCTFIDKINIDISIPLMGKKLEKMVLGYMKDGRQEKMDWLRRKLG